MNHWIKLLTGIRRICGDRVDCRRLSPLAGGTTNARRQGSPSPSRRSGAFSLTARESRCTTS